MICPARPCTEAWAGRRPGCGYPLTDQPERGLPLARLVDLVERQSSGKDRYVRPMFGVSCFDGALASAMQTAKGDWEGRGAVASGLI